MRSWRIVLAVSLAFMAVLGLRALWKAAVQVPVDRPEQTSLPASLADLPGVKAALGTREDPQARARYEWRRLRNPTTGRVPENMRRREQAFAASHFPAAGARTHAPGTATPAQAGSWQRRGPINVGGRSRAVAYDMSDERRILAGGVSGGMFLSEDGGRSWRSTFTADQLRSVTSIAQDTRAGHTDTWYVGTGEGLGNSAGTTGAFFAGNGVYKSTDGGRSWRLLSPTTSDTPRSFDDFFDVVWEIAVDVSNAAQDELYVATFGKIYRSTDGGDRFTEVLSSNDVHNDTGADGQVIRDSVQYGNATDVHVTSSGVVYAALGGGGEAAGVWRSVDGTDWRDITPAGFPRAGDYGRVELAVDPSNEQVVWAIASTPRTGTSGHMLMRYDAAGEAWTDHSDYLPTRGGTSGNFNSQYGYDLLARVHPDSSHLIFVGGRNLWRLDLSAPADSSTTWIGGYTPRNDGFDDYEPSGSAPHHPDQHALAFQPSDGDVMLSGSDGGIHRTRNNRARGDGGVKWKDLNDGYFTTQFYTVCFNPDPGDPTLAGGLQDNGTYSTVSERVDDPWKQLIGGDGGYCAITNSQGGNGTVRYISSQNGLIYRLSYDEHHTLTGFARVDPGGSPYDYLFINPFALDPADPTVMYLPALETLLRNRELDAFPRDASSRPASENWTEMKGSQLNDGAYTALGVSHTRHRLYLGTGDGRLLRLDNADTTSAGTLPAEVTGGGFPHGGYVSGVAVHPDDPDQVLVTFSNYGVRSIFYTRDGGTRWTDVSGNLEEHVSGAGDGPSVRHAAILPRSSSAGGTLYLVGTSTGLYATTRLDSTATRWGQEGPRTIGRVVVDQVRARPADGLVVAGTHGNGVYSTRYSTGGGRIPVELADFQGHTDGRHVTLRWTALTETGNERFRILQKQAGTFVEVGTEPSKAPGGTTQEVQQYQHRVENVMPGQHTFRLTQVDIEGAEQVGAETTVEVGLDGGYHLSAPYPNPFRERARLDLVVGKTQRVTAALYDARGRRVRTLHEGALKAKHPRRLAVRAGALASGVYFVRVKGEAFAETRSLTLVR